MSIMQTDPQACSLHLFGVEALAESLTLAEIDLLQDNKTGPPGVVPSDGWDGPRLENGQPDPACSACDNGHLVFKFHVRHRILSERSLTNRTIPL